MTQMPLGGLPYLLPKIVLSDPFGPSPLVTDLSIRDPGLFALASERGPAPTCFATGDLPPFLASGVDPQVLTNLPYHWRHAAASEANPAVVLAWIEDAAQNRERFAQADGKAHHGLMDYQARMEGWVAGLRTPATSLEDAEYPSGWQTPRMRAARDNQAQEPTGGSFTVPNPSQPLPGIDRAYGTEGPRWTRE